MYLCFTFGTDREQYWPQILETIGSYGTRVMRSPSGKEALTDIGRYLNVDEGGDKLGAVAV